MEENKPDASQAVIDVKPEAPAETALAKVETEVDEQTFLMATNTYQMEKAQKKLIEWATKKIAYLRVVVKDHEDNLAIAKKNKVRTEAYKRYIQNTTKDIDFYVKMKEALEAGYTIVPDMDTEIFAIRTSRKGPKTNRVDGRTAFGGPRIPDQQTNSPPAGTGRYVDPQPFTQTHCYDKTLPNGGIEKMQTVWATRFDERLDFPFKLAKPAILDAATKAMALKVFDEIGVLPKTRRQADPVIVGRITRKVNSYQRKSFTFIIAWFLDTKDL